MGEEQITALLRTDSRIATPVISELVDLFIQHSIDAGDASSTIPTRKTHLNQFARFCNSVGVTDITILNNRFIEQYFVYYRDGYSDLLSPHNKSTTNTSKRILKVFLTWVREYKEIDIRAVPETIRSRKDKYTKRRHIDREIIEKVIRECSSSQYSLVIAMFAEAGLRLSELINLKVSDIRWDELDVHGKGGVDRTVPITEGLAVALRRFVIDNGRKPDEYLFQNTRPGVPSPKLSNQTVTWHIKKWFKAVAGIYVTPHQLRHSFAVMLLLGGSSLVTIQKLLGHEDIKTTMVYLRITDLEAKGDYKLGIGKSLMA